MNLERRARRSRAHPSLSRASPSVLARRRRPSRRWFARARARVPTQNRVFAIRFFRGAARARRDRSRVAPFTKTPDQGAHLVSPPCFVLVRSFASAGAGLKCHELRNKSKGDLLAQLQELKTELAALRVAKVTGGAPNKLSKIKVVRLSIAQVLTVIRQNQLKNLREAYAGKKYLPLDLRPKKTRAIRAGSPPRRRVPRRPSRQKKDAYFPMRKYAIKA